MGHHASATPCRPPRARVSMRIMHSRAWVALVAIGLALTGCDAYDLRPLTSGHVGCAPDDIVIKNQREGDAYTSPTWTAVCRGKRYFCSGDRAGRTTCKQAQE